jgi:hypothetical protein
VQGSSWVGIEVNDWIEVSANMSCRHTFACQTSLTGLFIEQLADGIMGFSLSPQTCTAAVENAS